MIRRITERPFVRLFGASLVMQAMLSAANFLIGMILIRRTNDLQYGYYVLASNAILLVTSLQTAFIQPRMVLGLTRLERNGRSDLTGGLIRLQRKGLPLLVGGGLALTVALRLAGRIDTA